MKSLAAVFALSVIQVVSAEWIVATNGSNIGSGTLGDPISAIKAFSSTNPSSPGDTFLFRGGIYTNDVVSFISGTVSARTTIKPYENEVPIFTSTNLFKIEGSHAVYQRLVLMDVSTNRNVIRLSGFNVNSSFPGVSNTVSGCYVIDCGNAIFVSYQSTNAVVSGNLFLNTGYQLADHGHGHHLYTQNRDTDTWGTYTDNIGLNSFSVGISCRSTFITRNMVFRRNVSWNSGILSTNGPALNISVEGPFCDQIIFDGNYTYYQNQGTPPYGNQFYSLSTNGVISISNNVFAHTFTDVFFWTNVTYSGNHTFRQVRFRRAYDNQAVAGDGNNYYGVVLNVPVNFDNTNYTLTQWRSNFGNDLNGTSTASLPAASWVYVNKISGVDRRAHVVIYNWPSNDVVQADFTGVLNPGDTFYVKAATDPLGPNVASGTYYGSPISLPMTNLPAATPAGMTNYTPSWPGFSTFVLQGEGQKVSAQITGGRFRKSVSR